MQATGDLVSQLLDSFAITCSATTESFFPRLTESLFLRLPPELRNSIYELVLQQPEPIVIRRLGKALPESRQPSSHLPHHAKALTRTCKLIRRETAQLFYAINTFKFICDQEILLLCDFLDRIGQQNKEALRSIIVDVDGFDYLYDNDVAWQLWLLAGVTRFEPQLEVQYTTIWEGPGDFGTIVLSLSVHDLKLSLEVQKRRFTAEMVANGLDAWRHEFEEFCKQIEKLADNMDVLR
ncbi:hypothetical protein LTR17_013283 [Elasticomyces elasticus]|nr:hypothetical protein LTR17_013283 [Elasticomyces elasticus]